MKIGKFVSSFSATQRNLLACCFLVLLAGCADSDWTKALTGEPSSAVTDAPRSVGRPSNLESEEWPNVGDVPSKPRGVTTPEEWLNLQQELSMDRKDAENQRLSIEQRTPFVEPKVTP